ncbi:hypothetical protein N180_05690 [Pedobacter antarcticus 4BY]|uniref:tRNA threonylcarbamoyladenosine biosynthesis protein TsaE n=2 Tax=Pedobacter antarcticus TaxID=34086 RepID=A0A081PGB7_9SPHI|nr:tRNA (adenosine(37)-N6)-threonylcarbamoyltransferase complex ATPase subunit type 1 TsaE [Pedobacter antarcticus]KEQ29740.1 hypothetical protein N180_05690 [Pedobacter antarcticus 4BY]SFE70070.1 tRNA threonylcarbamoyladenosine biosynthesis protein TsaE [Pedobacter antarcticus]
MQLVIQDLNGLSAAAEAVLSFAGDHRIIIFDGEMGAGKTTLIKAICAVSGVTDIVSSPTFSIVNEYESPKGPIYHFDFYRIKDIREAYDIGYEEYFYSGNICLIEWPERVEELLPEIYIHVQLVADSPDQRTLTCSLAGNI